MRNKKIKLLIVASSALILSFGSISVISAAIDNYNQIKADQAHIEYLEAEKSRLHEERVKLEESNSKKQQQIKEQKKTEQQLKKEIEKLKVVRAERQKARLALSRKATAATQSRSTGAVSTGCGVLRGQLALAGLSAGEVNAAVNIASRESGCRQSARNTGSGACNVFQELPCGKWGGSGNLSAHIAGATGYANNRYGGWIGAWNAWQSKHWW